MIFRYGYDEWRKKRSCEYKQRFTRAQAQREVMQRGVDEYRAYLCQYCAAWHVGHWRPGQEPNQWNR